MLFITETISTEEQKSITNFFNEFDSVNNTVETVTLEEAQEETTVTKYLHSLVTSQYQKSVEDIANTKVGNKITRRRNLQQIMKESFFYGANRFGNNFIA